MSTGFGTKFTPIGDGRLHYMVAMYSYDPIELSPNVDADVSTALLPCRSVLQLIFNHLISALKCYIALLCYQCNGGYW